MEGFQFDSPLARTAWAIEQQSTGAIGMKLYPGAIILARHVEEWNTREPSDWHALAGSGGCVLEVGSGVAGFGALLSASLGVTAVATDLPAVLSLLEANMRHNVPAAAVSGGSCAVAPLPWGDRAAAHALRASLPPLKLIVGADVVYYEDLVQPLLDTLLALTESPPPLPKDAAGAAAAAVGAAPPFEPPAIVLSYVQRFKRAKTFIKKARKWFDITEHVHGCAAAGADAGSRVGGAGAAATATATSGAGKPGDVLDYDELSWRFPIVQALVRRFLLPSTPPPTARVLASAAGVAEGAAAGVPAVDSVASAGSLRAHLLPRSAIPAPSADALGAAASREAFRAAFTPVFDSHSCDYGRYLDCLVALRHVPVNEAVAFVEQYQRHMQSLGSSDSSGVGGSGSSGGAAGGDASTDSSAAASATAAPAAVVAATDAATAGRTPSDGDDDDAPGGGNTVIDLFAADPYQIDVDATSSEDEADEGKQMRKAWRAKTVGTTTAASASAAGDDSSAGAAAAAAVPVALADLAAMAYSDKLAQAQAVAQRLGIAFAQPCTGYVYVLKRKR